jgi:lysine/ornithine N-monooxygenase
MVVWKMPTFFNVWRRTVVHSYSKKMLESLKSEVVDKTYTMVFKHIKNKSAAKIFIRTTRQKKTRERDFLNWMQSTETQDVGTPGNSRIRRISLRHHLTRYLAAPACSLSFITP